MGLSPPLVNNGYAPISSMAYGPRVAAIGDSITARNADKVNNVQGGNWFTYFLLSSNGRCRYVRNSAVGGNTSTQLLPLISSEIIPMAPDVCFIAWGTNDSLDAANLPTVTMANTAAAVALLRAAGIKPVINTMPPSGTAALGAPASGPTLTQVASGGTIGAVTVNYKYTKVNGIGESTPSPAVATTFGSGSTNSVLVEVQPEVGVTGYKLYKSTDGGTVYGLWKTLITANTDGTPAKSFVDTGISLGAVPPVADTTARAITTANRLKSLTINRALKQYAQENGIDCVDMYPQLVDPTTGQYQVGLTTDATHPTEKAGRIMGAYAWTVLSNRFAQSTPYVTADNADPLNMITNGCFITGSASLPTGWSSFGGAASGFTDTRGDVTGFIGKALTATRSTPDVRFHNPSTITTGFSAGDTIALAFILQVTNAEANQAQVTARLKCTGSTGANSICTYILSADIGPVIAYGEGIVGVGTTALEFDLNIYQECTGIVGQLTVINLTTNQILTP